MFVSLEDKGADAMQPFDIIVSRIGSKYGSEDRPYCLAQFARMTVQPSEKTKYRPGAVGRSRPTSGEVHNVYAPLTCFNSINELADCGKDQRASVVWKVIVWPKFGGLVE